MSGALSHIRVLDLSRVLAGPWASQILADLGAEVIKIERPGTGDDTRGWGPPYLKDTAGNETHESAYFMATNRGKKSVTLNLSSPEGQSIVRQLATDSDVFIENYKVGDMARYGLSYSDLKKLNPRLVYCSITGFGQDGPQAEMAGYDFIIQGIGGLMSITGERDDLPGGGPQKLGVAFSDLMTGTYSVIAILAALEHRNISGTGQYIDMALLDVQVAAMERQQFGKPIAQFQLIQAMLADSRSEIYAARCMVLDAARRRDDKLDVSTEASCCKLFASEMCGRVADRAVQIFGGAGYIADYAIERFYRDVRLFRIYEGTTQIQQIVIARNMIEQAALA